MPTPTKAAMKAQGDPIAQETLRQIVRKRSIRGVLFTSTVPSATMRNRHDVPSVPGDCARCAGMLGTLLEILGRFFGSRAVTARRLNSLAAKLRLVLRVQYRSASIHHGAGSSRSTHAGRIATPDPRSVRVPPSNS